MEENQEAERRDNATIARAEMKKNGGRSA